MSTLMSGNEAIARGAWEAGVKVAAGYPGTPSTEILENLSKYEDVYCEWAPNEKVGMEVAVGACLTGVRSLTTMKHVGLNVAADPLMTLAYIGTVGGMVAVVADDPGMHSSQNEQDTRNYARFARIPVIEPSDSQEAKDYTKYAFEISEKFRTPVILRSTTRVSHSASIVETADRTAPKAPAFEKDPASFVPIPAWARPMRVKVEKRFFELTKASNESPLNRIEWKDKKIGIITSGITYQYVREVWPEASVLKLGWTYPFPDDMIKEFAAGVETLLVVEELDPIIEEHIKVLGIACHGRDYVSGIGELSSTAMMEVRAKLEGRSWTKPQPPADETKDLPGRPPVLCSGCPYRGVFYVLSKMDVIVTGDIGCYSLGVAKPLSAMDTTLCMGGGITLAHGMDKAGEKRPVVGIMGDSTFFHSGMTGALNIAYNKGKSTIIILDNRITAMTGHQDNPGTGKTLMGESTYAVPIEDIVKSFGIKRIVTIDPYDLDNVKQVIKEELAADEPSVIISKAPCLLIDKKKLGNVYKIDSDTCVNCRACIGLGCPAIESKNGEPPTIDSQACVGCALCEQICPTQAISREAE